MFVLLAGLAFSAPRNCQDVRFCRDNINRNNDQRTKYSLGNAEIAENVFRAPLQVNGAATGNTLLISKIKNSGIRVRVDPGESFSSYRYKIDHENLVVNGPALNALDELSFAQRDAPIKLTAGDVVLTIETSPLVITVSRNNVDYLKLNGDNFLLLEDGSSLGQEDWSGGTDHRPRGKTAVGLSFQFTNAQTELSGFSESNQPLDLGDVDSERRYALDGYSHYGYVPFLVAHNPQYAYTPAIFWMNPSDMFYRLQRSANSRDLSVVSEGGFVDVVVFLAPITEIHPQYYQLTGYPYFPPAWALGYHQCRYGYPNQAHVEEVQATLQSLNFPQDVQWLDIDHLENSEPFILGRNWWSDSNKFFNDAAAAGRTIVRITDPHMFQNRDNYPPFREADDGHYLVQHNGGNFIASCWPGQSGWPDFLRKDVRDWWGTLFKRYDFPENCHVWNDMNEAAAWGTIEDTLPKDGTQISGAVEVREVHSLYGFSNSAATHDGLLANFPNRRPFVLTRSFFAGSQKYTWHWSGDNHVTWDHLAFGLDTLLTSNIAGVPFTGSDLGGFGGGDTTPYLLARWYQLGAYTMPLCREHSEIVVPRREPYLFRESNPAQYQTMINAVVDRYRLLPLIYTAARDCSEFGQPFVAPLWYYFPQADIDHKIAARQPIVGGKLMVVPQLNDNGMSVTVTKPPGLWFNLRTGEPLKDGQQVSTDWGEHTPSFIRGGTVIGQFSENGLTVKATFGKKLTLYIAYNEQGQASGSMYFDDLVSLDHTKGQYVRIVVECNSSVLSVRREGSFGTTPTIERVIIYGASALPTFNVPGGSGTFTNGVVDIQGVALRLSDSHHFASESAGKKATAISTALIAAGVVLLAIVVVAIFGVLVLRRPNQALRSGDTPLETAEEEVA
jgi:alpha 1,3-glucosidase